jgi:16S rRNA C1402 N4-methylase RsmH
VDELHQKGEIALVLQESCVVYLNKQEQQVYSDRTFGG